MARADVLAVNTSNAVLQYNGGGTTYLIQKHGTTDTFYMIFVDGSADVVYAKSTDGGFTWGTPVTVFAGTIRALACWYERWSGVASDKILMAYSEDTNSDILFRSLDISTDTLGSETTVFAGASTASGGALTIWRSRGTNTIRVAGAIDGGTEDGAWSSTDSGATWGDTIADPSEGGSSDQYFGLPGWNADANDEMIIFVDASANGLSVKRYDDSANTWTESAIIADGSLIDVTPANSFPHVACFVDVANSRNIVMAWTAIDTANADLRAFIITDTTITEVATNVVLNSTDDQGLVAAGIDTATGTWYAFYCGKSDGSETWSSSVKVYYKTSTDAGATWGSETALTSITRSTPWLACTPRFDTSFLVAYYNDHATSDQIYVSVSIPSGSTGGGPLVGGRLIS